MLLACANSAIAVSDNDCNITIINDRAAHKNQVGSLNVHVFVYNGEDRAILAQLNDKWLTPASEPWKTQCNDDNKCQIKWYSHGQSGSLSNYGVEDVKCDTAFLISRSHSRK